VRTPTPRYTFLGFELNHLLDQGLSVDIDETRERLDQGTVFEWLEEQFAQEPYYLDLSLYEQEERETIIRAFQSISNAVDARKKFGVERNGIALLVAFCLQILQAGPEDYENG
jgi:hypothetical protein